MKELGKSQKETLLEQAYKGARIIIDSVPDHAVERWGKYPLSEKYGSNARVEFNTGWQGHGPQCYDIVINTVKDGETTISHHISTESDGSITENAEGESVQLLNQQLDEIVGGRIVETDLLGKEIVYESDEIRVRKNELLEEIRKEKTRREELGLNSLSDEEAITFLTSLREELSEHWPDTNSPDGKGEKGPPTPDTVAFLQEAVEGLAMQAERRNAQTKFGKLDVTALTYADGDGNPTKVIFSLAVPEAAKDGVVIFDETAWQFDKTGGKRGEGYYVDRSLLRFLPSEHPKKKLMRTAMRSAKDQLKKEESRASQEELKEGITYLNAAAEFIRQRRIESD